MRFDGFLAHSSWAISSFWPGPSPLPAAQPVNPSDHIAWVVGISTVFATLVGPILAVQAQKWIERFRERRQGKLWVFSQLMMTRQYRLSPEHVRALNLIELQFYGLRFFGFRLQSSRDKAVVDAWRDYLIKLNPKPDDMSLDLWISKHNESFYDLLKVMARATGFDFSDADLQTGSYSPQMHTNVEMEYAAIRQALLKVVNGESSIGMRVVEFPKPTPEAEKLRDGLVKIADGIENIVGKAVEGADKAEN
jgi:hypothetical protein